jgi:hypothetical protein
MIRTIRVKQFPTFEKAVIGGTYVTGEGNLYLVSSYDIGEEEDSFVITNLSTSESSVHIKIDEITEILKKLEARVTDVEIMEIQKTDNFVSSKSLNAMVDDYPDF